MTGDFNYSDIDWRDFSYQNDNECLGEMSARQSLPWKMEVTFQHL